MRRYAEIAKASGNAEKRERMTVEGFKPVKVSKFSLTDFLKDGTIKDKESAFKQHLKNGDVLIAIEARNQKKHIIGPVWKNQVKLAITKGQGTPKSLLNGRIDPSEFVKRYAGTGKIVFPKSGTTVHEFITINGEASRTFEKKESRYVPTSVIQIKYTPNGVHIFPTKPEV